jgi:hypothetical protein
MYCEGLIISHPSLCTPPPPFNETEAGDDTIKFKNDKLGFRIFVLVFWLQISLKNGIILSSFGAFLG